MKYRYKAPSWSYKSRIMSDKLIHNINKGSWSIEYAKFFLCHISYAHQQVRMRALTRLMRWEKRRKLHENPQSIEKGKREIELFQQMYDPT